MSATPPKGVDHACLCDTLDVRSGTERRRLLLARAQDGVFIVLDDEASIRAFPAVLVSGFGTVSVETNDAYPHDDDGEAAMFRTTVEVPPLALSGEGVR